MGVIDYKHEVAAQVEQNAAEQKAAVNETAWQEIINRYVIKDHAANRRMVEDFSNGEITLVKFKFLVDNPPQGFQLDWSTEVALKTELIEKILASRQWSPAEVKAKQRDLRFRTLRMLREELQRLTVKEHLSSNFTVAEVKAGLADYRKAQQKFFFGSDGSRWERLPGTIVPRGFVSAISTSEFLKHIARHDVKAFRHYVERYGSEQVNSFLNS